MYVIAPRPDIAFDRTCWWPLPKKNGRRTRHRRGTDTNDSRTAQSMAGTLLHGVLPLGIAQASLVSSLPPGSGLMNMIGMAGQGQGGSTSRPSHVVVSQREGLELVRVEPVGALRSGLGERDHVAQKPAGRGHRREAKLLESLKLLRRWAPRIELLRVGKPHVARETSQCKMQGHSVNRLPRSADWRGWSMGQCDPIVHSGDPNPRQCDTWLPPHH